MKFALTFASLTILLTTTLHSAPKEEMQSVLLITNAEGKTYYEVVPASKARQRLATIAKQGRSIEAAWSKLSATERRDLPKPREIRAKVEKTNIKNAAAAERIANVLNESVSKSKRTETGNLLGKYEELGGERPAERREGEGKSSKFAILAISNSDGKAEYQVVPDAELADRGKAILAEGREARANWEKLSRKEKSETPRPREVKVRAVKREIRGEEAAEKAVNQLRGKDDKNPKSREREKDMKREREEDMKRERD